jgi:hypothetical protein
MPEAPSGAAAEFQSALNDVETAERYLKQGLASPRIPLELRGGIMWAIWGWLKARGVKAGSNNTDAWNAYSRAASKDLLKMHADYSRRWMMLEYRLIGDPDDAVDRIPPEEWLPLARQAAQDARALVEAIQADAEGV